MHIKITSFRLSIVVTIVLLMAHLFIEVQNDVSWLGGRFFSKSGLLYRLELSALDTKFQLQKPSVQKNHVIVARIDENSIARYGLWPWNRSIIAQLIEQLKDYNARVIGFDVIFADQDKNSTAQELVSFQQELSHVYTQIDGIQIKAQSPAQIQLKQAKKSVKEFLNNVNQRQQLLQADTQLEKSIKNNQDKVITGFFVFRNNSEMLGMSTEEKNQKFKLIEKSKIENIYIKTKLNNQHTLEKTIDIIPFEDLHVPSAVGVQSPLDIFAKASQHLAFFNVIPDIDGRLRRIPVLFKKIENKNDQNPALLKSLTLSSVSLFLNADVHPLVNPFSKNIIQGISLVNDLNENNNRFIPTDAEGHMLIRYAGDPEQIVPAYSIVDIIEQRIPKEAIQNKIVLVGATAIGNFDLRSTPFSVSTPGVYVHATAIENILNQQFLIRFYGMAIIESILILILGIMLGIILPKLPVTSSLFFTLGVLILCGVIDLWFIFPAGYWVHGMAPMIQAAAIFIVVTIHRYLTEEKEKQFIRKAFQFYLTKSVVDQMLKDTSSLKLGGQKKELSVIFTDIRGFTSMSEQLEPEKLAQFLNSYLTPMTEIIFKHEGTLDKYIGDALMAIFGAPLVQQDHAQRACLAALDMSDKLNLLQQQWSAQGLPAIEIGIGINSGPMAVGNMGSEMRFDYTVIGDNVNLASRLEGINKEYGTRIIISESTYLLVKNEIVVREIDIVRVAGKKEPVAIYELRSRRSQLQTPQEEHLLMNFSMAISAYRQQRFSDAITLFENVLKIQPNDKCSQIYIKRCVNMQRNPPAKDWDGVYIMSKK